MRPGAELMANEGATMAAPPPGPHSAWNSQGPHSAWHSPVPYLFGGLAAMLGLIAFALLILACSYWKLSGYLDSGSAGGGDGGDGRPDGKAAAATAAPSVTFYEEKIVVIMAGEDKPTFLATPMSCRACSFGDNNGKDKTKDEEEKRSGDSMETQNKTQNQSQSDDQNPEPEQ